MRPRDEDIYARWFQTKFDERNWKAAQKVRAPQPDYPEKSVENSPVP